MEETRESGKRQAEDEIDDPRVMRPDEGAAEVIFDNADGSAGTAPQTGGQDRNDDEDMGGEMLGDGGNVDGKASNVGKGRTDIDANEPIDMRWVHLRMAPKC